MQPIERVPESGHSSRSANGPEQLSTYFRSCQPVVPPLRKKGEKLALTVLEGEERKDAINVQNALHEWGQDVSVEVAAAVWRHYSRSLKADWMSGAGTVASAKVALFVYLIRRN